MAAGSSGISLRQVDGLLPGLAPRRARPARIGAMRLAGSRAGETRTATLRLGGIGVGKLQLGRIRLGRTRVGKTIVLVYATCALTALAYPQAVVAWLDEFEPNPVVVAAQGCAARIAGLSEGLGIAGLTGSLREAGKATTRPRG